LFCDFACDEHSSLLAVKAWQNRRTHSDSPARGRILDRNAQARFLHLGDNCVLALLPLPVIACSIGNQPANGDLFNKMH
jgi:hypothetical protein